MELTSRVRGAFTERHVALAYCIQRFCDMLVLSIDAFSRILRQFDHVDKEEILSAVEKTRKDVAKEEEQNLLRRACNSRRASNALTTDGGEHVSGIRAAVCSSRFFKGRRRRLAAQEFCASRGMSLASIHSDEENEWVRRTCMADCWIGFSDAEHEWAWKWSDGTKANYRNWNANAGIGFKWSIFDGGIRLANSQAFQKQSDSLEAQAASEELEAIRQVESSYSLLETSKIAITSAKEAYRYAYLAQEAARTRYNVGVGDMTTVVQTMNQLARASAQVANAILDHNNSVAELYRYSATWPEETKIEVVKRTKNIRNGSNTTAEEE